MLQVVKLKRELQAGFGNNLPSEIVKKDIIVPTAPNNVIVMKFRKNFFFFTWKLVSKYFSIVMCVYKNKQQKDC